MRKYKVTILFALLFTIPLLGYFVVNAYWWLFDGNHPIPGKMTAAGCYGVVALVTNMALAAAESGGL